MNMHVRSRAGVGDRRQWKRLNMPMRGGGFMELHKLDLEGRMFPQLPDHWLFHLWEKLQGDEIWQKV